MLKVKKTIQNPKNKSQNDDLTELQNGIESSIKNLYISNPKKKKTINELQNFLQKLEMNMQNCKKKIMK